ncbi:MAG: hypothetical protein WAM78_01310, partial [Candidatus Sulfotelmatobacter sp.]
MCFVRRIWFIASVFYFLALALSPPLSAQAQAQASILGFTPASAAHEAEVENKFKAIPSPDEERRQHHI